MLRNSLLILALFVISSVNAQTVTGFWYGRADVALPGNNNNYLTELILKQKGNDVEGVFGYYFRDSYQSFFIHGKYDSKTRMVQIDDLPMLFYKALSHDGIECPMRFLGKLRVSKVDNTLNGSFYTDEKYKYTCPELRVNYTMDPVASNPDSAFHYTVLGKKLWQPQKEDFVITNPSGEKIRKEAVDVTVGANTAKAVPVVNESLQKLVTQFESRKKIYSKDLLIESDSIRVSFYDNGDIDGDSISVFLNNTPVMTKQLLSSRATNVYLALDSTREINELSMFAENLGKYPPNTALMVITDGVNRYDLYLSSSLTQNASVRLRRKKNL
jgi:hypothetical protein